MADVTDEKHRLRAENFLLKKEVANLTEELQLTKEQRNMSTQRCSGLIGEGNELTAENKNLAKEVRIKNQKVMQCKELVGDLQSQLEARQHEFTRSHAALNEIGDYIELWTSEYKARVHPVHFTRRAQTPRARSRT